MSILLTGGTGFIGSHTAGGVLNAGYTVVIADDFSNSNFTVLSNIKTITGKTPRFYPADVACKAAVEQIFAENSIDAVIHFAGYKAVGESVRQPLRYFRNNLDTVFTVLDTMASHSVKRFIFSSSATVYGASNPSPYLENMPTGGCSNPYGWSKFMIERVLLDTAGADPGLSVMLLRYFNPIGAHESGLLGEKPNGVPNNLMPYITQVAAGLREKLPIYGGDYPTPDGTGVRDFIHVVDLAKGHVAALNYALGHTGAQIVNLGAGVGYSVLDVVREFESATGIIIPYEIFPRRPGDLAAYYAGTEKARTLLGWRAERSLTDMCRDSWRWEQRQGSGGLK